MRSHLRVLPREQLEESICELADRYPKCFFVYGRLRLPLKIGIETDLRQDGVDEATVSAVEFYRGDWGYLERLHAGSARVGLNGVRAGTVTEQESAYAQRRLKEERGEVAARRKGLGNGGSLPAFVTKVMPQPVQAELPEAQPTLSTPPVLPAPAEEASPLARLQVILQSASDIATNTKDEILRAALTTAALRVLASETAKAITTLEGSTS
jgi:sRNA-binding protein